MNGSQDSNEPETNGEGGAKKTKANGVVDSTTEIHSKSPRRVKVYLLQGDDWLDNGTGYCLGQVDSETKKPYFIVRNEMDSDDIILKSYLEGYIQYQRQQETLIVWTDLSGKDLALSFQENEGCADLCEFIVRVQQESLSPMISLYYVLSALQDSGEGSREITELITGPITYPDKVPTKEAIESILEAVRLGSNSQYTRSKILTFIIDNDYLSKLFTLFDKAEREKDLSTLHVFNDIMKSLIVYNDILLLGEFFKSEETVLGLMGALEYDRDYPEFKACHREYLLDPARFKMVIDIAKPPLSPGTDMSIFRRDFILGYLKNVVLARKVDDQTLNSVSTFLYNNQIDIINYLKDALANDNFLERLFQTFDSDDIPLSKKRDAVRMLHQYAMIAKSQLTSLRSEFLAALVKSGLFECIKFALKDSESEIRVVGTELLTAVIDQDASLVNSVLAQQADEDMGLVDEHVPEDHAQDGTSKQVKLNLVNDMSLIVVLGQLLLNEKNPGLKIQAYEAIRTLLYSALSGGDTEGENEAAGSKKSAESEAHTKKYFESFYEVLAPIFFEDFMKLAGDDVALSKEAERKMVEDPILYQHLCDIISFCCREHETSISRQFFFEKRVLKGILMILKLNVRVTLKLGVMRCFKSIIILDDTQFCRYIIQNDLFESYFYFYGTVAAENSLANSLCLDLLEIIIRRSFRKNYRLMAIHIYNNYKLFLETQVNYVSTGQDLVKVVESHVELLKDPTATSVDGDQDAVPGQDHSASSPVRSDEGNGADTSKPGSHHNLFESIEQQMESSKREREGGAEGAEVEENGDNCARKKPSLPCEGSGEEVRVKAAETEVTIP